MKHFARIVPLANQQQHELLGDQELDALLPGMTEVDEDEAYHRSQAVQAAWIISTTVNAAFWKIVSG